ncbi:hypothetical protein [Streptomyces sp. NPDC002758]
MRHHFVTPDEAPAGHDPVSGPSACRGCGRSSSSWGRAAARDAGVQGRDADQREVVASATRDRVDREVLEPGARQQVHATVRTRPERLLAAQACPEAARPRGPPQPAESQEASGSRASTASASVGSGRRTVALIACRRRVPGNCPRSSAGSARGPLAQAPSASTWAGERGAPASPAPVADGPC